MPRDSRSIESRYPTARSAAASPSPKPQEIGSLEKVGIKELWPNESADFTRWLKQDIGELDRFLGLGMTGVRTEFSVGDFRFVVVAGSDGGDIVIESPFGRTDHRHLDQFLKCLSDRAVQRAVWIVEAVGAEHVKAVRTLNERNAGQFWLVQVVAVRIGRSQPAPLFSVVVHPSKDAPDDPATAARSTRAGGLRQDVGTASEPVSATGSYATRGGGPLLRFWAALIQRARHEGIESMFGNLNVKPRNWLDIDTCHPGLVYRLAVNRLRSRIVFTNSKRGEWMDAYSVLDASRADIDQEFACHELPRQLEWEPVYNPGRWFVRYVVSVGWADTKNVTRLGELAQAAAAMKQVLDPYIRALDPNLRHNDHGTSTSVVQSW